MAAAHAGADLVVLLAARQRTRSGGLNAPGAITLPAGALDDLLRPQGQRRVGDNGPWLNAAKNSAALAEHSPRRRIPRLLSDWLSERAAVVSAPAQAAP